MLSEKFDLKVQISLKIQILKIDIYEMKKVIELRLLLKLVMKQDLNFKVIQGQKVPYRPIK
jgi:hypothetical protein